LNKYKIINVLLCLKVEIPNKKYYIKNTTEVTARTRLGSFSYYYYALQQLKARKERGRRPAKWKEVER
jgi:hypothetical protein